MIITGIVIVAVAVILSIISVVGAVIAAALDRPGLALSGGAFYILMGIMYVVGLAVTAIGITLELT